MTAELIDSFDKAVKTRDRDAMQEMEEPNSANWAANDYTDPTGKKLGIFKVANTSLYRIRYIDEPRKQIAKTIGSLDQEKKLPIDGMFTKSELAEKTLMKYLKHLWQEAERTSNRKRIREHASENKG